ncbi:putative oxidoreductase [Setomelanomma holmii]|uniref:Oxidoreductase n=1 Tax=Setomelanomma holmii TaxID=210430 RepID=A0A9P4H5M5_9PLEO|nr:putative oxidoreductase [Setomelanomma holmii]
MDFAGHVIAITGAASGIGLSTAHLLASRSATLALADVNSSALEKAEKELKQEYPNVQVLAYVLDIRHEIEVAKWIETIIGVYGRLDGGVNMAGVIGKSIGISDISAINIDEWDFIMSHQLRHMGTGGSIVNASSVAGVIGMPKNAAYTASKHGVIGLTRSAAKEVGDRGIRVNAICPGFIDTPMQHQSTKVAVGAGVDDEARKQKRIKSVALQRGGRAEEVAELIVFLLGNGSSFITGNAVSVDGGWNC